MSISGVQGQMVQVQFTVVECTQLKNTEGIKRQDSYVCIEYGSTKFRTLTCQDGGKDPVFKEQFMFSLIEGLKEINVVVWNSNPISFDSFIGSIRVQLQDVVSGGYIDRSWPLQSKTGRYAGEVKLIMQCDKANKSAPPSCTSPYTPPPYTAMPTHPNSESQPPIAYSTHSQVAYSYPPPSPAPPIYPSAPYAPPPYASSYSPLICYRCAGEVKLIMQCDKANKPTPPSYTSPYTPPPYTAMPTHPNSASQPPIPYSTHPQVACSYPPPSPGPSMYPPPPYAVSPYVPPSYASSYSPPGFYGMYNQPPY